MKKFLYIIPILFLLAIGCTEDPNNADKEEYKEGNNKFLTVSIMSPSTLGSRAGELGDYEDGSETENYVKKVRFYFFDVSGDPALARRDNNTGEYYSYIDWTPSSQGITNQGSLQGENTGSENIEKILTYNMSINHPNDKAAPASVIAIINPTSSIENLTSPKISDLNGLNNESNVTDYQTGLTAIGSFVMSNSVYVGNDGQMINASLITKYYPTIEEAAANPVKIFVERVLARVDFSISVKNAVINNQQIDFIYDTGEIFNNAPIYVKLLGWQITSAPIKSRLMKYVNTVWNKENLFGNQFLWNTIEYRRCFWAMNPTLTPPTQSTNGDYTSFSYTDIVNAGMSQMSRYTQENANPFNNNTDISAPQPPTKIIIAAQLIDTNGNPMTIAEYGGKKYTEQGLFNLFASSLNLYSLSTNTSGAKIYTKITPSDLILVTQNELIQQGQNPSHFVDGSYYVYAMLSDTAKKLDWYQRNSDTPNENGNYSYTPIQTSKVNDYIFSTLFTSSLPMVWNEGHCYYYFNIRHLGAEGNAAYYGIVRNHLYKANLTKIIGFGTPVYNPDQDIYEPESPEHQEGMINAEINILSWRIVSQDYELNWDDLNSDQ